MRVCRDGHGNGVDLMWFDDVMREGWDVEVCNPWGRERVVMVWCGDGLCPAYTVSYSGHPGAGVEPQGSGLQLSNGGRGISGLGLQVKADSPGTGPNSKLKSLCFSRPSQNEVNDLSMPSATRW